MTPLMLQLEALARDLGATLRTGPQPPKPHLEIPASIGRFDSLQKSPHPDPYLDYTDDYSEWKRGQ